MTTPSRSRSLGSHCWNLCSY